MSAFAEAGHLANHIVTRDTLTQVETLCQIEAMAPDTSCPPFEDILPAAPFSELHTRIIDAPIDEVWPHCLAVTAQEIRTLGPLMAVRGLPAAFTRKSAVSASAPLPLLDVFESEGFVILRRDAAPSAGRASIVFGAAGRFWSVRGNSPVSFGSGDDFLAFDRPDHAKTIARLDAIALDDGTTRVETETLIAGTDSASSRKFAPYWALIRLPSGLIRRSWLAAIDRRVAP